MDYSKELLDRIWGKGIPVEGYNPNIIRKDACGAWILRNSYELDDSDYCWVVDHIFPLTLLKQNYINESEINLFDNLRPLNKKNYISKANDYPNYKAVIIAEGDKNISCDKLFTVNKELQQKLSILFGLNK